VNPMNKAYLTRLILLVVFFALGRGDGYAQERAIDHAPIGVMGDHYHSKGEWMVSARYMRMLMSGNRTGTTDLTDQDILALSNPYQMGNMSTNLSVVPQDMAMNMTMLGAMYAPSDVVTLMGMGMFTQKSMNLTTYQGAMPMSGMGGMGGMSGTQRRRLGSFSTSTGDLSDISLSGLIRLYEGDVSRVHAQIGIEQSVGARDSIGEVLTPMNMRMKMTLPYGMQIGDGTTSAVSALTHVAALDSRVYGWQLRSQNAVRTHAWNFGDAVSLTGWIQQELARRTSVSLRFTHQRHGAIEGRNTAISAPVQTANPANYGGNVSEVGIGFNQLLSIFPGEHSDRIGIELFYPVQQNLNGPQMKSGVTFQVGYQKSLP
jgi:hypothetical protein